ncbi:MAG: response regulator transcription factor [Alphaproteobacteria bacterium]|nr:response regulator transcription factor [Alphaproteobacteria bacterium]
MTVSEPPRILIVEDDLNVVQGLLAGLRREGFAPEVAMDGADGTARVLNEPFDLVLLDLMLPESSGFEVLQAMSGRVSVPVIVLSARTELDARLRSFQLGAIDFVSKPFWMEELVARIRTRLAIREERPHRVFELGECRVNLDARTATRDGADLKLTAIEFNVLAWLIERPGEAVRRHTLAVHVLGMESDSDRTVDSHVSRLRRKLGPEGARIKTVWGIGYRLEMDP